MGVDGLVVAGEVVDNNVAVASGVVEVEADGSADEAEAVPSGEDVVGVVEVEADGNDEAVGLTAVPEVDGLIAARSGDIGSVTPAEV